MLLLFVGLANGTPLWLTRVGLYQYLALEIVIWMMYALGYNLLLGYGGLPSFGHGAFFGIGAYAFGLLQLKLWPNLWFDLAGGDLAAVTRRVVAAFISHRRGIYYALLTIAFGQVFWFVAIKWHSVTGGEDGLLNLKRLPADFGFVPSTSRATRRSSTLSSCLVAGGLCSAGASSIRPSARAPLHQAKRGARARSRLCVWLYKWMAFTLSAAMAGLAGALFAHGAAIGLPERDEPASVGICRHDGADRWRIGELLGTALGRAFFILARDLLGAYTETWLLWYGLLFMAVVLWKPEGLAGLWQAWHDVRARRRR